ncbi:MAG TPA: LTA synthase family protein [Sulfurimonas sp.]|uniref:LTA synthase family protein n=1 Tax=Sulfurimonas sp. TaxID=2022749 RepID=UPI002CC8E4B0|nr:LTA synthase family protein [Sulfurimonas sp.]HUH42376.1 LTA synthase family protein [Sulfurimonas sp.]
MQDSMRNRFHFIGIVFWFFLVISTITRTVLLVKSIDVVSLSILEILKIYIIGAFYDFISAGYLVIPFVIYLFLIPQKIFNHKVHRYLAYAFTYVLLFGAVFLAFSEWFFWDEFSVRFNFIAVDYLIYTKEVIGNIKESYPMGLLLSIIAMTSGVLFYLLYKTKRVDNLLRDKSSMKQRVKPTLIYLLIPIISFAQVTDSFSKFSTNQYNNELSKSGLYSLFGAFRNNTLDYDTFYLSEDELSAVSNLKKSLSSTNSTFLNDGGVTRDIVNNGQEKDYNVVMIVVESLSGKFLESLGGDKGLTPNLDSIIKESMFFNNFYATGTRTIRGMESITLSVPPMPGRSIVKRPDNHNMYSSGFIFRDKGYETKFIYGGYGYFDNMNEFFSNNGFDIVDRSNFSKEEDTFHTVWGVCDEDLLNKTLKEADASYRAHKPFMSFVMTTTNHRPYDYPNGRVDVPSHTGRDGAVKYTDYAIGDFLSKAKNKPWFKNTIFVIVADHCAVSAGKVELPLDKYHIPMIVYAPEIIKPQVIDKLSSQIDVMPTLFSMLNWSYKSKFYGRDILEESFEPRALVGTYQKLGLYKDDVLSVLSVGKKLDNYKVLEQDIFSTKYKEIPVDKEKKDEILSYYQSASYLQKRKLDRYDN